MLLLWVKLRFSTTLDIEMKIIYLDRACNDGQEYHCHYLWKLILGSVTYYALLIYSSI